MVIKASTNMMFYMDYHAKLIHIFSYSEFQIIGFNRFEDFEALTCRDAPIGGGQGGAPPPTNFENDAELVKIACFVGQIFSIISLKLCIN